MSSCSNACTCDTTSRARNASIASRIRVSPTSRCSPASLQSMGWQPPGDQMFSFYRRIGAQRYQERHGLDLEDFAPGQRFRHRPGLTLSQQDNVDEALDTLN